jgi:uncharacterized membrane protein
MRSVLLSQQARALLGTLSFVMCTALIHVAVVRRTPLLEWLALASLLFVPLSIALFELRWRAWLIFAAGSAALWWLVRVGGGWPLLYLPSIGIPAALAWFFGRTLRHGRQPLITSIAVAATPGLPDYLLRYTRRLTAFWTGIFVAMVVWDAGLALFAPHGFWSFMANFANYLLIGAVLVLEYLFRRLRFRHFAHPGFAEYLKIVVRANPRRISRG